MPRTARRWARAETARRRRFPFSRSGAGAGLRDRGARACAEDRPAFPRSGAGRAGRDGGSRWFPTAAVSQCGETESGWRPGLNPWRIQRRELDPEARRRAVGPRNEVSAGSAAARATGAGRRGTRFRATQRTWVPSGEEFRAGLERRECPGPDPRKPCWAPGE